MQLDALVPPANLPDVEPAPLMEVLLFEDPWLLVAGVFVVSVAAAFAVFRAARTKQQQFVAALLVFEAFLTSAVLVALAAYTVTDREMLNDQAEAMVDALADWDADELEPMLADTVRTVYFQARSGWNRQQLLDWIRSQSGPYGVQEYSIKDVRSQIGPGSGGLTRIEVSVTPERTGRPLLFICMIEWLQTTPPANPPADVSPALANGWQVDTIRPLWLSTFGDLSPGR